MTDNIECITDENGTKYWYQNGKIHRIDGPAIERSNSDKSWWLNGKRHRIDGPAIERSNGDKSWWLNDKEYTFSEWCELTYKSYEEKCELVLMYG